MRTRDSGVPASTTVRSIPHAANVVAESFIAAILPVIPDGEVERFGESAFFRGLIELLSVDGAASWIATAGNYHILLLEEPAPFPYDCRDLCYHHIAAWITSHAATSFGDLAPALHAYAWTTRARLAGLPIDTTTFPDVPRAAYDICHASYKSRIPDYRYALSLPVKDYASGIDVVMDEHRDEGQGPAAAAEAAPSASTAPGA
ncbi:hypothetical protein OH76DRAFT_1486989 [Lentinus brumalis]|uniref:Uncharacterized protein n=1 Tax=Lentinus brumalis TaxID=2498619 RepID=A0A371CW86_9APHY|nr:hypothetical protein OH76DRAFT_1486989 [Polyporus brumalis]